MRLFFIFRPSKIHIGPTDVVSSLSPLRWRLSFNRHRHSATSCHTSFIWSQDELVTSASFFGNVSFHRLSYRGETEALNPHHRCRPPSPYRSIPTLHYYKKIISILATLPATQPRLHFTSSLARGTMPLELHPPPSFPFTAVPRLSSLRTTTPTMMN
jgi:hypothetical protein